MRSIRRYKVKKIFNYPFKRREKKLNLPTYHVKPLGKCILLLRNSRLTIHFSKYYFCHRRNIKGKLMVEPTDQDFKYFSMHERTCL